MMRHAAGNLTILFLFLVSISNAAVGAAPIMDLIDMPIPVQTDGSLPESDAVLAAIVQACKDKGWVPTMDDDGSVNASIWVRSKHYAEVNIKYGAESYSITYVSSKNLNYDPKRRRIHRNYNRWVMNLSQRIVKELGLGSET